MFSWAEAIVVNMTQYEAAPKLRCMSAVAQRGRRRHGGRPPRLYKGGTLLARQASLVPGEPPAFIRR